MSTAIAFDPLRPRSPGGMGRGVTLAVIVHALLVVALAFGVSWRAREPEGLTAELWAVAPQLAAPPAPPPPRPAPAPERRVVEPPRPDPQIAIEKERKEREARERAEQAEREKAEREKAEKERAEKQRREEEAREKRIAALAEKQRKEQLQRIIGQAGGAPGGTAAQSAGPSASYAGRVIAKVRPNIMLLASVPDDIEAEVEVRAAPDGSILGRRLTKSSGNKSWDEAVLRAIDRTGTLPRDVDGRVPSPMVLVFTPNR